MIEEVKEKSMCIGCGFCALACPAKALSMVWTRTKTWAPDLNAQGCTHCGLCLKICPNGRSSLTAFAEQMAPSAIRFGLDNNPNNSFCITWEKTCAQRIQSASGGTTTALLNELLRTHEVDCVVCAAPRMAPIGEPHFEMRICSTPDELEACRSSAYGPLRYDLVLEEVATQEKSCVLVGLPCTLRAIQNLPPKYRKAIKYTVALMCSHNVTDRFSDFMACGHSLPPTEPFQINLRDKQAIPNANEFNTGFKKVSGEEIRTPRFRNGFTPAWRGYWLAQKGCLYCPDFYGATADLSVKDAWGRLSRDPLGITLCIVRHSRLLEILQGLGKKGRLHFEKCEADEIDASQRGTVRYKQEKFKSRWRYFGFPEKKTKVRLFESLDCALKSFTISLTHHIGQTDKGLAVLHQYAMIKIAISRPLLRGKKMIQQKIDIAFWKKAIREAIGMIRDDLENLARPLRLLPFAPPEKLKNREGFHVLLTGGYGYSNVGDEAQLNANIVRWKKRMPAARLTALSPHPESTESRHDIHSENAPRVVWFNSNQRAYYWANNFIFPLKFFFLTLRQLIAARFIRAGLPPLLVSAEEAHLLHLIHRADVLHISGGGFLTGITRSRLWENMLLLRLAHLLGTPSILTGQTIGVFKSGMDRHLSRWGLRHAKAIYLRDKSRSEQDLKSIGIEGGHVQSLYDDALFCARCSDEEARAYLAASGLDPDKPFVVVHCHGSKISSAMKERIIQRFAELCIFISKKWDMPLLLLPMTPPDEEALKTLQNKVDRPTGLLAYDYDFRIARGVIAKAEWVFTMKHHPIIFAQGEGVPVVSIYLEDYYDRKNKGAMAHFGQETYCLDTDRVFSSQAETVLTAFIEQRPQIQEAIRAKLEKFRAREEHLLSDLLPMTL